MFKITDHVEFDNHGRAVCPCCETDGKGKKKNLSLVPDTDGAYKCHRGCTPDQIKAALGISSDRQIPASLASKAAPKSVTVSPQEAKKSSDTLLQGKGKTQFDAKAWLLSRKINSDMIRAYGIGLTRGKLGTTSVNCISIPIPNRARTAYYLKKRVEPWNPEVQSHPDYQPWKQYGVPQMVYFTHNPPNATTTWLCEGEWDAIRLGWAVRHSELGESHAVATFTCGATNIPPAAELERLPGEVIAFYDRNDKPLKNGDKPGELGVKKVATALQGRCRIALVPMPENCTVHGWDVSNALDHGYSLADFAAAATAATRPHDGDKPDTPDKPANPLRERMVWNDDLIDSAPDYTEWLVPDLLTADELFLVAAGPRAGKSLLAMTLALSVASGTPFLGRPVAKGTVLYVCLEDSKAKIKEREQAQGWTRGLPVAWFPKFKLSELPQLREIADELDPRLIVIDTLSRAKEAGVSESSAEMSQVLEPLQEMANEVGCCVLLVHHTGKVSVDNASQIDLFDTIRGSSAIRAVCRGSMVIAAGERDYRLCVENGWGKHDLKVVLDANTLTWKLLGKWSPVENVNQKTQILDCLHKLQFATLEQIHEATGIPKKSLYEQLSRLQASDNPQEQVVKEGSRRSYTYRLSLFNTIQQLNSVLNSPNPDQSSDNDAIQQKNDFSSSGNTPKPSQSGTSDALRRCGEEKSPTFVEYRQENASNPDGASVPPIQQIFNRYDVNAGNADGVSTPPIQQIFNKGDDLSPSPIQQVFSKGDEVEVWNGSEWVTGIYQGVRRESRLSLRTRKLEDSHRVTVGNRTDPFADSDVRLKNGGGNA